MLPRRAFVTDAIGRAAAGRWASPRSPVRACSGAAALRSDLEEPGLPGRSRADRLAGRRAGPRARARATPPRPGNRGARRAREPHGARPSASVLHRAVRGPDRDPGAQGHRPGCRQRRPDLDRGEPRRPRGSRLRARERAALLRHGALARAGALPRDLPLLLAGERSHLRLRDGRDRQRQLARSRRHGRVRRGLDHRLRGRRRADRPGALPEPGGPRQGCDLVPLRDRAHRHDRHGHADHPHRVGWPSATTRRSCRAIRATCSRCSAASTA